jgi:hypothetical protein
MLRIGWEWVALVVLLLLLLGYVAYQKYCWPRDYEEDEEERRGR